MLEERRRLRREHDLLAGKKRRMTANDHAEAAAARARIEAQWAEPKTADDSEAAQ
jgi:hypothetical protein